MKLVLIATRWVRRAARNPRYSSIPSPVLAESRKTGVPLPSLHSALFYPDYAPAITTGVTAMTAIGLDLLH